MPRSDYKKCKVCERHVSECGPISHRGYCGVCGPAVRNAWNDSLHFHEGGGFQKWRRAHAAAVGGVLVDDIINAE